MIPYRKVAEKALYEWNYKYAEEYQDNQDAALKRAHDEAETLSFEELESNVWAQGSMTYAIEGIANYLKEQGMELTPEEIEQYKKAVFEGPENAEIFKTVQDRIGQLEDPNKLMISTLSDIHDGWVKDNQKKFFAREKKHQHMPLELIGWNEVKSDLLFLRPILEASGLEIDESTLEGTYKDTVLKFLEDKGIQTKEDLQAAITQGTDFYPALEGQDAIVEALSQPEFVSETLMPQLEAKGNGNVEQFISENKKTLTPLDIETAVQHVTRKGLSDRTSAIKEEFNPEKENEQSNDEISIDD